MSGNALYISRIVVIERIHGPDILSMETGLPNGGYPFTGPAHAEIRVASQTGLKYVAEHFPDTDVEVIQMDGITG